METDQRIIQAGQAESLRKPSSTSGKPRIMFPRKRLGAMRPRVMGVIGVARDITERKSLRSSFSRAQKMEALGDWRVASAYFNNLLTAILGVGQLLKEALPRELLPAMTMRNESSPRQNRAATLTGSCSH